MIVCSLLFEACFAFRIFVDVINCSKFVEFHSESLHFQHWGRYHKSSVDQRVIKMIVSSLLFTAFGAFRMVLDVLVETSV
jgi:hypothetical protein